METGYGVEDSQLRFYICSPLSCASRGVGWAKMGAQIYGKKVKTVSDNSCEGLSAPLILVDYSLPVPFLPTPILYPSSRTRSASVGIGIAWRKWLWLVL